MEVDLTVAEARVLGCLVEKEATTPDVYPLTTNSLVSACNQKTNRDPVMNVTPVEVDGALLSLRQKGLVRAVHVQGSRSTKHRHVIGEATNLTAAQVAVFAVLLLRGAQTVGELRGRTERIHEFHDLSDVEAVLVALADYQPQLAEKLPRAPGQKESRWALTTVESIDHERAFESDPTPSGPSIAAQSSRADGSEGQGTEIAKLRSDLDDLQRRFDALCELLGETIGE